MPKNPKPEVAESAGPPVEVSAPVPPPVEEVLVETAPQVGFDRWFAVRKFKPHWKAGMMAFTNVSGRKTMAEWDATFKAY